MLQCMEVSDLCHSLTDCKVGFERFEGRLLEGMLYCALRTKPLSIFCQTRLIIPL